MPTATRSAVAHHDYSVTLELFSRMRAEPCDRKRLRLRNQIVERNLGLVQKAARQHARQCREEFEDLVQIGVPGLIRAVNEFDPSQGNRFSSFAMPWIRGAIQHYLRDNWGLLKPPREYTEIYARVKAANRKLLQQGRQLDLDAVATGLGIAAEKWASVRKAMEGLQTRSLDESPFDVAADEAVEEPALSDLLKTLTPLQRGCLTDRVVYGLAFDVIARRRGIGRLRAEMIVGESLDQLRSRHREC